MLEAGLIYFVFSPHPGPRERIKWSKQYGSHAPEPTALAALAMGCDWVVFRRQGTRTR